MGFYHLEEITTTIIFSKNLRYTFNIWNSTRNTNFHSSRPVIIKPIGKQTAVRTKYEKCVTLFNDLTTTRNQVKINPIHSFISFQGRGNKYYNVISAIHIQFRQFFTVLYLWQTTNLPEIQQLVPICAYLSNLIVLKIFTVHILYRPSVTSD